MGVAEEVNRMVSDLWGLTAEELVRSLVKIFKIKHKPFRYRGLEVDFREVLGELLTRLGVKR